jgi:hypothetical protein
MELIMSIRKTLLVLVMGMVFVSFAANAAFDKAADQASNAAHAQQLLGNGNSPADVVGAMKEAGLTIEEVNALIASMGASGASLQAVAMNVYGQQKVPSHVSISKVQVTTTPGTGNGGGGGSAHQASN